MTKKEKGDRPVPPSRMRVAEALGKWFPEPETPPVPPPPVRTAASSENTSWTAGPKIRDHDISHDREVGD